MYKLHRKAFQNFDDVVAAVEIAFRPFPAVLQPLHRYPITSFIPAIISTKVDIHTHTHFI